MDKPLCIYHGNCADGFGAAWAVRARLGDIDFHPGVHQEPPPDITGRHVIMVDFSYKRPVIEEMRQNAASILVLDHHKSAAEDLQGYPRPESPSWEMNGPWLPSSGVYVEFDMDRSGAGMAWDYFHPAHDRPALINHIEDRDLWRFNLSGTRQIQAAVFSYPYEFEVWDELFQRPLAELQQEGEAIERKHFKDINELANVVVREMDISGHRVLVANVPYTLTSDMGHKLAEDRPFAACYWDTPEGRVFSLRSTDDGIDVSEVAVKYGGGGHRNASGFRVSFAKAAVFEVDQ